MIAHLHVCAKVKRVSSGAAHRFSVSTWKKKVHNICNLLVNQIIFFQYNLSKKREKIKVRAEIAFLRPVLSGPGVGAVRRKDPDWWRSPEAANNLASGRFEFECKSCFQRVHDTYPRQVGNENTARPLTRMSLMKSDKYLFLGPAWTSSLNSPPCLSLNPHCRRLILRYTFLEIRKLPLPASGSSRQYS